MQARCLQYGIQQNAERCIMSKENIKNLFGLLNKTDILTFVYLLINILYVLIGYKRVDHPQTLLVTLFSILVAMFVIAFYDQQLSIKPKRLVYRLTHFVHLWYAPIMYGYFFEATSRVNRVIFKDFLDHIFQKWDFLIFGYQPAMHWGTVWDWYWLQELLHFSYFAYYLMIFGVPFYIYFRKKEEIFKRLVFNITFVFYCCYLIYMILPVIGGRALEGAFDLTIEYRYGIFTHIMAFIYRSTPHLGGAFPSSHVAIALTICLISMRYYKYLPYVLFPITFLLAVSTVYCHYHYFVDTIAGVFCGLIFFYFSEKLYNRVKIVDKKCVKK